MKIHSVSIYNSRSIQKLENLDFSNGFDVLIGQNDSGKSTVLYALDNFFKIKDGNFNFEIGDQKINDLCHDSIDYDLGGFVIKKTEIGVLCCFKIEEEENFSKRSNLLEFSNGGFLKVLKKVSKDKIYNKKQYQYYILGETCVNEDFQKINDGSEKDLIELMEKYPDSKKFLENINDKGKPENIERKKALLRYARENFDVVPSFDEFNFVKDEDEIWPEFDLIESHGNIDSNNKIIDSIFTEISKELIEDYKKEDTGFKTLLRNLEDKFGLVADKICKHAQDSYIRNLESIKVVPKILLKSDRDFLIKTNGQTEHSHFNCQGDGTKRRLMVSILQCGKLLKKEQDKKKDDDVYERLKIWAFDEPELHLHPGAQRELFASLKIFKEKGFQILCATHSTVFVDNLNMKASHLLDLDSDLHTEEIKKDIGIEKEIKLLLGVKNSDIFFSNGFIVVEGETEQVALPILYEGISKETFDSVGIKIICSKGCDKSYEKINFYLNNFNNTIGLLDRDVESNRDFKKFIEDKSIILIGKKCDFEDSFSNEVWLNILNSEYKFDGFEWEEAILNELREEIEVDKSEKKFLKLIKGLYRKKYIEINGSDDFSKKFEKIEIGKKLAEVSVELEMIPNEINDLFNNFSSK